MKKFYYGIFAVLEGLMIVSTIINLIYCIITNNTTLFLSSLFLPLASYLKFNESKNIIDILLVILFLALAIVFYVCSVKELFDDKNKKAPFTILNLALLYLSVLGLLAMNFSQNESFIDIKMLNFYSAILALSVPLIFMKWSAQNKAIRSAPRLNNKEDPLPENFQMQAKSYAQIKHTALGTPIIGTLCFIICLYLSYLGINLGMMKNLAYIIVLFLMLTIAIGTNIDCKKFEKSSGEKPPTVDFLKKLNIILILSILLFTASYFLFYFI